MKDLRGIIKTYLAKIRLPSPCCCCSIFLFLFFSPIYSFLAAFARLSTFTSDYSMFIWPHTRRSDKWPTIYLYFYRLNENYNADKNAPYMWLWSISSRSYCGYTRTHFILIAIRTLRNIPPSTLSRSDKKVKKKRRQRRTCDANRLQLFFISCLTLFHVVIRWSIETSDGSGTIILSAATLSGKPLQNTMASGTCSVVYDACALSTRRVCNFL